MSAAPVPPFEMNGYKGEAAARASQLAALIPVVYAPSPEMPAFRARMLPYLETYGWEARDRGIPAVRPLAMQFPEDAVAAARTDEFMSGDEILVAPLLEPGGKRSVYLPRGIWTELRTGAVYKGRQEIAVEAPPDWTPLFARNGMLVPLAGKPLAAQLGGTRSPT
jgi:alpha-glucosidase (family GH31 glycosyl hydrolase)